MITMPPKSLVGNIYGNIKAIEYIGNSRYKCQCLKCNAVFEQYSTNIKSTLKCQYCKPKYKQDLTGKQYGYLTVIGFDDLNKKWICKCKCGAITMIKAGNLKTGNTQSCGRCKYIEHAQADVVGGTRLSQLNKKLRSNNTSGYPGVYYISRRNKWRAEIAFRGKKYYLGYYNNKSDAIKARATTEEKLHSDFWEWYNDNYN